MRTVAVIENYVLRPFKNRGRFTKGYFDEEAEV